MVGLVGVSVGRGFDLVDVSHSVGLPWQEEEEPSGRRMRWVSNSVAGVVVVVVEGWKFVGTAWMMQGRVRMGKLRKVYGKALLGPKLYALSVAIVFPCELRAHINIPHAAQAVRPGKYWIDYSPPSRSPNCSQTSI